MQQLPIDEHTIPQYLDNIIYRGYGVISKDGSYGDGRSVMPVTVES
jgi:hypothetical protein